MRLDPLAHVLTPWAALTSFVNTPKATQIKLIRGTKPTQLEVKSEPDKRAGELRYTTFERALLELVIFEKAG